MRPNLLPNVLSHPRRGLWAVVGLLCACGVGPRDGEVRIDARTMLLESTDDGGERSEVLEVGDGHLVLSAAGADRLLDAPPGQILVSQQAGGLLRTIERSWAEGDRVMVKTSPALLTDAVIDGDASLTRQLDDGAFEGDQTLLSPLTGAWLWRQDLGTLPGGGVVRLASDAQIRIDSGHLELRPTLDLDLSIRWGRVRRFGVAVGGSADTRLAMTFEGGGAFRGRYAEELWTSPTKYMTWFIGPVPVVVSVRARVSLEGVVESAGQAQLTTGAGASGEVDAGVAWASGQGWSTHATHDFGLHPIEIEGSAAGSASVSASLVVRIETKLYEAAGPWLAPVNPFAKATVEGAPVCEATVSAGVKGAAGVSFAELPFRLPMDNPLRADLYETQFVDQTYPAPWMFGCDTPAPAPSDPWSWD